MKKILLHIGVTLASAIVLCVLGIVISSFGKHKATLSKEETVIPIINSTDTITNTQSQSVTDTSSSEASTGSDTSSQDTTASETPATDVSQIVVDDEDATADDEYDSFAIANKIKKDTFVNVRLRPDIEEEVVGRMYHGSVAQIVDYVGEGDDLWLKIISGNVEGYIKAQYFTYGKEAASIIDSYTTNIAIINCETLHVRTGPGTDFDFAGYLERNEKVPVISFEDEWLQVQYAGSEDAYICARYANIMEDYVTAKSMAEVEAQEAHAKELQDRLNQENVEENTEQNSNSEQSEQKDSENSSETSSDKSDNEPSQNPDSENSQKPDNDNSEKPSEDNSNNPGGSSSSDDSLDAKRQAVVDYALQFVGCPYVNGGQSLSNGTDCSGLTCYVYQYFGYYISRTPGGQLSSAGISVSRDDLKPGDIICYQTYTEGVCSHVGMYIGDGKIVHAANPRKGIVISKIDIHTILGIKRIIY